MFKQVNAIALAITLLSPAALGAEIEDYKKELIKLEHLDQQTRNGSSYEGNANDIDKANQTKLKALIKKYGFPTISKVGLEAHRAAFLVAHHAGYDKKLMRDFRDELQKRLGTGEVDEVGYAYIHDRVSLVTEGKQVYATQGSCWDGKYYFKNIRDLENLDRLRSEVGLPSIAEHTRMYCTSAN